MQQEPNEQVPSRQIAAILAGVEHLDARQREVLLLHFQGLRRSEIANALDFRSEGSVYPFVCKAKALVPADVLSQLEQFRHPQAEPRRPDNPFQSPELDGFDATELGCLVLHYGRGKDVPYIAVRLDMLESDVQAVLTRASQTLTPALQARLAAFWSGASGAAA